MLPPALGNPGPRHRLALTVPPGPRRVTDDGERARFHVATVGKARSRTVVRRSISAISAKSWSSSSTSSATGS